MKNFKELAASLMIVAICLTAAALLTSCSSTASAAKSEKKACAFTITNKVNYRN